MSDTLNKTKMNILIIGTGVYVCGRGTAGYGTILPAIYERKKQNAIGDVFFAGTSPEGIKVVKEKVAELNKLFGVEINPEYCKIAENRLKPYLEQTKL